MNPVAIKNVAVEAKFLLLTLVLCTISGCATGLGTNPHDPFEPWNRSVSNFNEKVDIAILKPVATVYTQVTPHFLRTGVSNFFNNLTGVWTAINSVLQLKPQAAVESVMSLVANTVFGLGGILDVAGEMHIERHKEDFGQTLGRWGVPPGPYLVLPLLGPSTLRDTLASTWIARGDLVWQLDHIATRNSLYALRLIDKRSNLLRNTEVLDAVALDKYSFTRDIFLQVRRNDIFDGNAPDEVLNDVEKPGAKPGVKPEIKPEVKPEPSPETRPEEKSETNPETEPEVLPEKQVEVKPAGQVQLAVENKTEMETEVK